MVYSPHWYDLHALFNKAFGDLTYNVQGLSRVCFASKISPPETILTLEQPQFFVGDASVESHVLGPQWSPREPLDADQDRHRSRV